MRGFPLNFLHSGPLQQAREAATAFRIGAGSAAPRWLLRRLQHASNAAVTTRRGVATASTTTTYFSPRVSIDSAFAQRFAANLASTFRTLHTHRGVRLICAGWTLFIAENLLLSENRGRIIGRIGDSGYHFLYNTCSTLSLGCIALGYLRHGRRQGPLLWKVTPVMRGASLALSMLGALGLAQVLPSLRNPATVAGDLASYDPAKASSRRALCPMDFEADRVHNGITEVKGVKRVTRHASLWSLALLSAGCALRTPFATEVFLFTGLVPTVLALGWHMDSRFRRQLGGDMLAHHGADWPETSHIPFGAILFGEQKLVWDEFKPTNSALAGATVSLYGMKMLTRGLCVA